MSALLSDLLGLAYWAAILGGILWWVWVVRRSKRSRSRTPREEAELAGLRAAVDRDRLPAADRPAH